MPTGFGQETRAKAPWGQAAAESTRQSHRDDPIMTSALAFLPYKGQAGLAARKEIGPLVCLWALPLCHRFVTRWPSWPVLQGS